MAEDGWSVDGMTEDGWRMFRWSVVRGSEGRRVGGSEGQRIGRAEDRKVRGRRAEGLFTEPQIL